MGLPWFRLDSNIGQHDKILALLADPSPQRWQAFTSYVSAIGWSNGAETDGRIPKFALPVVHGTAKTARLLEKYGLWDEAPGGWCIRNFGSRQPLKSVRDELEAARQLSSRKANCVRWHGKDCWKNDRCSIAEAG